MSKNIREHFSEEVIRKNAASLDAMERYNQAIRNDLSDFYKENKADADIIIDDLIDVANKQLDFGYAQGLEKGYDKGFNDGAVQGMGIGVALCALTGVAGVAYIYKDQIKEYGKYIKNKIFKKKDDDEFDEIIRLDEDGNIIQ